MTQQQDPPGAPHIAAPQRRIADMDVPTFFALLMVTVTLAVVLGGFIFYYVVVRALGAGVSPPLAP